MRRLPELIPQQSTVKVTSAFTGYNHNEILNDGEMFDMQNLSGDKYPLGSTRRKRGISSFDVSGQTPVPLTGIHGRDQLVFIRGEDVYYNFAPVTGLAVSTNEVMLPKQIVSFGAYVLIFPDKVYFNTADLDDMGTMERLWPAASSSLTGADVQLSMCRGDGTDYDMTNITEAASAPADPANNALWIDTSGSNDVLMQYSEATGEWVEVASTFVKIACTGIGAGLKEYDTLTISGLEAVSGSSDKIKAQVEALNGSMIVYFRGEDYIVVAGLLSESQAALEGNEIRADLKIPDMDYIVESNNRLWGCTYGLVDGEVVNEIRCSALGDFRNWNRFMGLSTDSWVASVGTDGAFTGAIAQRGYPVFSKEGCFHRVSGSLPSNFSIQTTMCRGVQRDCWRSMQVVAENIYYKSRSGVMVYDGNMPVEVSEQLGEELYSNARAGVLEDKYYISMEDSIGNWRLFVYDTAHGTWWKEDSVQALGFGAAEDDLFFIDEDNNTLVSVRGSVGTAESDFDWAAEFELYGVNFKGMYDDPKRVRNSKYLSMFKVRASLAPGAWMKLWIKYDNKLYEYIGQRQGQDLRTFVLPVIPKRADHIRFKLTGHGEAKIYDISRVLEVGGDG